MAAPTKTTARSLFALASNAASTITVGAPFDVSTLFEATVLVQFGRRVVTAAVATCNLRLEGSTSAYNTISNWFPITTFSTGFAVTTSQPVTTSSASGQSVVTMTTTTGMVVGDIVYIDNTTIGNSEWGRIKTVTAATSITLEDNLLNTQAATSVVYRAAELFGINVNLASVKQIRLVVDGSGFTMAHAVQATFSTLDTIA